MGAYTRSPTLSSSSGQFTSDDNRGANQGGIDWGATNATFGLIGELAETALGTVTSEFGIGLFAIADWSYRSSANAARLCFYLSGDKNKGDGLPGNLGDLVDAAIDGNYNLDRPGGKYQNGLGLINDAATMYFTGTTRNASAISSLAAGAGAISDTYTIVYTYFQ